VSNQLVVHLAWVHTCRSEVSEGAKESNGRREK
jgi:hypothetical protein